MTDTASQSTWNEFLQALHAPAGQDFDAFYWIYRLAISFLDTIVPCRSYHRRQKLNGMLAYFRPVVPVIGMGLVLLCGWSYFSMFRYTVVRTKWCGANSTESNHDESVTCHWEFVHGSIVTFFMVNIIGHYMWCTFGTPGVVTATCYEQAMTIETHTDGVKYHPDPNLTYCDKCEMKRPARAHHCRICKICAHKYDHHCPWTNNCIGLNNYRSFVLLVFYILAGCTYGVFMLGMDFYQVMRKRIELKGWSIRGAEHGTGLLDLPLPWVLLNDYQEKGYIDGDIVLRAAFPLMFFVGIIMYWFLGYHMRIIIAGYTTLEDMSRPQFDSVNPFDGGAWNNLMQVFGRSWVRLLAPLPRPPPHAVQTNGKQISTSVTYGKECKAS